MSKIYGTIEDNMSLRKFKVYITNSYEPHLPNYFKKNNINPIYSDDTGRSISFMSIQYIVDAVSKGSDITIPSLDDLNSIIDTLEVYTTGLTNLGRHITEEARLYKEKCLKVLAELIIVRDRMFNFLKNKYPEGYRSPKIKTLLDATQALKEKNIKTRMESKKSSARNY